MNWSLVFTIGFITFSTILISFIRRKNLDKCLKDFRENCVNVLMKNDKMYLGNMRVESTGIEIKYETVIDKSKSRLIYKNEYMDIKYIIRYYNELSEMNKQKRERSIKRSYNPNFFRRMGRSVFNSFRIMKDSLLEVINLIIGHTSKKMPIVGNLSHQEKYTGQIKKEIIDVVGTSYEPLLEKIIGRKVLLELNYDGNLEIYIGILKEYTAEFIELLNVEQNKSTKEKNGDCDMVFLRKYGTVRNLVE